MASPLLPHSFRDDADTFPSGHVSAFRIPLDAVVQAIAQAAEHGADRLYEAMLKAALAVELRAQTYGLAIYQQALGEPLTLKWVEGLNDEEVEEGERAAVAIFERRAAPEIKAGDHSFSVLLAQPTAHTHGATIYGRCMRPLGEGQVREIKLLGAVAQLAHRHVALKEKLHGPPNQTSQAAPELPPIYGVAEEPSLPGVVYESRALAELARSVGRIKNSDSTVLITGESGTGKELIAHAIHRLSRRAAAPFIPFNCTAAPGELVESLLFGHRKGSFTGAHTDHEGLIRAAEGGTLFLDEIGDLPLGLQPKLLRFLQEGEVHTLGERGPRRVNVRVVVATHKNLEQAVKEGAFRQDLYYRVASLTLRVPPLRERPEDVAALISHFLTYYTRRNDRNVRGITWEAITALQNYSWPGNVRELAAEVERLVLYADPESYIGLEHLSPRIWPPNAAQDSNAHQSDGGNNNGGGAPLEAMLQDMERRVITEVLKRHNNNVAHAAAALGLGSRQTLYKKLKRLSINIGDADSDI